MPEATQSHFFLSSVTDWAVTTPTRSLSDAIKSFEANKLTYQIFFVPVAHDQDYQISCFAPQVKGAFLVEVVEFKKGRRVRK